MKLSDYKGEEALDILAELIDPASVIFGDKRVTDAIKGDNKLKAVKVAIKEHKKEVIEILAALEKENPEEYAKKINLLTLPIKVISLLNDPELMKAFSSQGQTGDAKSSGSASVNTEE